MVISMQTNVGGIDKYARILIGIGIIGLGLYYQNWLGLIGVPILLTGVFGYCYLYTLFGFSTCPLEKKPQTSKS